MPFIRRLIPNGHWVRLNTRPAPPHICNVPFLTRYDDVLAGSIWMCDECHKQYELTTRTLLSNKWIEIT